VGSPVRREGRRLWGKVGRATLNGLQEWTDSLSFLALRWLGTIGILKRLTDSSIYLGIGSGSAIPSLFHILTLF
jgi:hypothetical protein